MPTHAERRILPHTPEQLYALVADVERYPEFLPWAVACRIRKRQEPVIWADLVIGFKMIRERFTSKVTLNPDALRVDVEYVDGPFHYLNNHWVFEAHADGCAVDFFVDFEFKNKVLQTIIGALFNEAVKRMVAAFENRAKQLYG
ncbi:ubiquinone-binding protein [Niveispirillum lacus]|uniref:Ubiquinone-binding protein n=1 Tax=Niveispirillum lacus TaxID=1981099 RepID=A0A255YWG3_9PROT|nr:type II toxin-antitoxin system RatA family toxin [Niveispirillum lacus]OYQ33519.1 ubiquinone-binding protein [Niveispirillum lacus]